MEQGLSIDTKATGCLSVFSLLGSGQWPEYFVLLVLDHLLFSPVRHGQNHNITSLLQNYIWDMIT